MRLITAHRILIGAAIAFFVFYAGFQIVRRFVPHGDAGALVQALVSLGVAATLAWYYRTLARKYPTLTRREPGAPGKWNARS